MSRRCGQTEFAQLPLPCCCLITAVLRIGSSLPAEPKLDFLLELELTRAVLGTYDSVRREACRTSRSDTFSVRYLGMGSGSVRTFTLV